MKSTVDATGLSCPQPVLMTLNEIKNTSDNEIRVMVDTEAARENVSRAAESRGWKVSRIDEENNTFVLLLRKA